MAGEVGICYESLALFEMLGFIMTCLIDHAILFRGYANRPRRLVRYPWQG